jgi:ParB family chromosome partitioning protein
MNDETPDVQKIPIEQINVLNLRRRNKFIFQGIVSNISNIGLKKPITVARRAQPLNGKIYDLVDGHGRLEACIALGQTEIPALITDASEEECLLMSLIECLPRRAHSPAELLGEISQLKRREHKSNEIARKINREKADTSR